MNETIPNAQATTEASGEVSTVVDGSQVAPVGKDTPATDTEKVKGNEEGKSKPVVGWSKSDLKIPENSLIDAKLVDDLTAHASKNGWPVEIAQAFLDQKNADFNFYQETQKTEFEKMRQDWRDKAKADKEIGGDSFPKNLELVKRFVEKYASKEFIADLDSSGYGDNYGLVKFIHNIIKAGGFAEDTMVTSRQSAPKEKTLEEIFYGAPKQ